MNEDVIAEHIPNVSALEAGGLPRHRWYFFKEAFSPGIVDHAVADAGLPPQSTIFDPFSGSGTTPLAASFSGHIGVGAEVNPFLRFVARSKAKTAKKKGLLRALDIALSGSATVDPSPLETFSTFSEHAAKAKKRGKWLFNSEVLRAFQGAWATTSKLDSAPRSLLQLCLIGAALDSANAAKDGKCLRYKRGWESASLSRENFVGSLQDRVAVVLEDLEQTEGFALKTTVALADSRSQMAPSHFDLCVTSPPYLNSFDYTDVYRPELFLGGFVADMEQLRQLRLSSLRSHVQVQWDAPEKNDFGPLYRDSISDLKLAIGDLANHHRVIWDQRIPLMVQAYFEDMATVLKRLRRRAKPHASVWLVVSTSAYAGVEIPVDLIIADIAGKNGWFMREVVTLRHLKRVAGQQWHKLERKGADNRPCLRESVVILDAEPRRRHP
jgi:DNA modification methylase